MSRNYLAEELDAWKECCDTEAEMGRAQKELVRHHERIAALSLRLGYVQAKANMLTTIRLNAEAEELQEKRHPSGKKEHP